MMPMMMPPMMGASFASAKRIGNGVGGVGGMHPGTDEHAHIEHGYDDEYDEAEEDYDGQHEYDHHGQLDGEHHFESDSYLQQEQQQEQQYGVSSDVEDAMPASVEAAYSRAIGDHMDSKLANAVNEAIDQKGVEQGAWGLVTDEVEDVLVGQDGSIAAGPSQAGYDQAWKELSAKLESGALSAGGIAEQHNYLFIEDNEFVERSTSADINSMFEKAMESYHSGRIQEAVLRFEAIVQHESGRESDESWRMLGMCHAENDEDRKAITCLNRALDCDPYNLEALLALGTSYVNELDSARALETLRTWVAHNPHFHGLEVRLELRDLGIGHGGQGMGENILGLENDLFAMIVFGRIYWD